MENIENTNSAGNTTLGQNIRNIRKRLNLTQEEFAEKLNLNPQFVSQVETGKVGISIDTLINICNLANCSSVAIFHGVLKSPSVVENYELLTSRDKSIIDQMITCLLNTK
ncbi:MAG: hypothetical protein BHW01_00650 [Clostridium sp. 27_14]|jgi:transcriptional regulator with XRE-family HTH domain|nr:MAG: hypothetical protein BHW01_00650 [Clostridium sp. 27_14]